jgi:dUTP pyrophosphatase
MEKINVSVCAMYDDVEIPKYQTSGSAGCDVKAYFSDKKNLLIRPRETVLVPTGLKFSVPDGYEMQIRPRSGLSLKTKLRIANSPGTLDSDYRGILMIILENTSNTEEINIDHGDRIAQLVFAPVVQAQFNVCTELDNTERGSGGFGSTGK